MPDRPNILFINFGNIGIAHPELGEMRIQF